jgi:hypothetical protein
MGRTVRRPREIVPTNLEAVTSGNLIVDVDVDELFALLDLRIVDMSIVSFGWKHSPLLSRFGFGWRLISAVVRQEL